MGFFFLLIFKINVIFHSHELFIFYELSTEANFKKIAKDIYFKRVQVNWSLNINLGYIYMLTCNIKIVYP